MTPLLTPPSISSLQTRSLEQTFAERLAQLPSEQLLIDIENETDNNKLDKWLEMFGIEGHLVAFENMRPIEKRDFITGMIGLKKNAGTKASVIRLCQALGAQDVRIQHSWQLKHNHQARYNGAFIYDAGRQYAPFAIDLFVRLNVDLNLFKKRLNAFFNTTQPLRIYINDIIEVTEEFE